MTYWSIWWRTFAWMAAVAGAGALVAVAIIFIPADILTWIGFAAFVLLIISLVAFGIWSDQGGH